MFAAFDIKLDFDREKLCKRMHIEGESESARNIRKMLPEMENMAKNLVDIKACYLIIQGDCPIGIDEMDHCDTKVICLCYASEKIDRAISELTKEGNYLEAYLLNDMVNDLLFHGSDQLNHHIECLLEKSETYIVSSVFPGENGIPPETQKILFENIKPFIDRDIKMNHSYMLVPEKAMLYAFGADKNCEGISIEHDCSRCNNKSCYFRDADSRKNHGT